jgi:F-actin monooxygenase
LSLTIDFNLFFHIFNTYLKEERMARLADIDANRIDRQTRRRQHRQIQTQNFLKSLHMLQANNYLRESGDETAPFEDYSIYMYRQNADEFTDRVKDLEKKLLYPVRILCPMTLMCLK